MSAQPDKRLDGDDGANPDKGPFGSADVLLIKLGSKKISQEDWPDDDKRPNVGVEVERERAQKLGALNLRIVDEGRHLELLGPARARNPGGNATMVAPILNPGREKSLRLRRL